MTLRIAASLLFALAAACCQAQPLQEGVDYQRLAIPEAATGPITVVEVFAYTCPHCATLEPVISAWRKELPDDVAFSRQPVPFGSVGEALSRAFHAAQATGTLEQAHPALFRALHVERKPLRTPAEIAALLGGEDGAERFLATMNSFAVDARVARAKQQVASYGVEATPTLIIAGRYRVTVREGGFQRLLSVADQLIAMERQARAD